MFSANSIPAFGATAPAFGATAPAFGAASAPAFGAATGGFGASTVPAFGATAPAFGAAFGASSAAGAFGSAAGAFGTTVSAFGSSASAFGATGAGAFGATGAGAFGATGAGAFGATGAGAFGATAAGAAFGAFGQSTAAFGAAASPFGGAHGVAFGSTPSAFGSTGAFGSTFGTGGGLFGSSASTLGSATGVMGPQQILPYGSTMGADAAQMELDTIEQAYREHNQVQQLGGLNQPQSIPNPQYRFQHLFFQKVLKNDPLRLQHPPAGVDHARWREALENVGGQDNPDDLWPVPVKGFKALEERFSNQQRTAIEENVKFLADRRKQKEEAQRKRETVTQERINTCMSKHEKLTTRLILVMRKVSLAEESSVTVQFGQGHLPQLPADVANVVQPLSRTLQRESVSLRMKLDQIAANVKLGPYNVHSQHAGVRMSDESLAAMQKVLLEQTEALGKLCDVVKRDVRDLDIMEKCVEKRNSQHGRPPLGLPGPQF